MGVRVMAPFWVFGQMPAAIDRKSQVADGTAVTQICDLVRRKEEGKEGSERLKIDIKFCYVRYFH